MDCVSLDAVTLRARISFLPLHCDDEMQVHHDSRTA